MPKITAFAKIFRDWEGLIGACIQSAAVLLGIDAILTLLQGNLAEARQLKIEQEDLEGRRKAVTQRLGVVIEEGRDNARKLRALVLSQLGPKSEQLTQFGIIPIRKGSRKGKTAEVPVPAPTPEFTHGKPEV